MIGEGYLTLIVGEVALLRVPVMGSSVIGSWTSLYVYDFSHRFECSCSEVDSDAYDYQKRKTNFRVNCSTMCCGFADFGLLPLLSIVRHYHGQ